MSTTASLRRQKTFAVALLATGLALLAYMIPVEGEPGALPLALMLAGGLWFTVAHVRGRRGG